MNRKNSFLEEYSFNLYLDFQFVEKKPVICGLIIDNNYFNRFIPYNGWQNMNFIIEERKLIYNTKESKEFGKKIFIDDIVANSISILLQTEENNINIIKKNKTYLKTLDEDNNKISLFTREGITLLDLFKTKLYKLKGNNIFKMRKIKYINEEVEEFFLGGIPTNKTQYIFYFNLPNTINKTVLKTILCKPKFIYNNILCIFQ